MAVGPGFGDADENRRQRDAGGAGKQRRDGGVHAPPIVSLLQVVPALQGGVVALARLLDIHLELHLAAEVLLGRPGAAGGAALAIAGLRLDALVAPLFGFLQREGGGARLLVGLVKLRASVLRQKTRRSK